METRAGDVERPFGGGSSPSDGGLGDMAATLAELEIIEVSEFNALVNEVGGSRAKLFELLRRNGFLTPFQLARIMERGVRSLKFDEYALLDKLGEGGAGEVFKARNLVLGRHEAIKIIQTDSAHNEAVARRFQREARVLAQLEHQAIVPIHKIGRYQDTDYIAMKFVEGKTLQKRIDESNQGGLGIPVATACRWIIEAAEALDYAHKQGIIHRDIKPGNLMVTLNGRIMVLDMGIARLTDPGSDKNQILTVQARGMGTPEYMPPEQWADATAVSPPSDIYSLGCTFVHLLTGRPPYSGRLNELLLAHSTAAVPKVRDKRRDVPKTLDVVVAKMLAKHAKDRYATARDVIEALEPIAGKLPSDGRSVSSISIDASSMETARSVHGGQPTHPDSGSSFLSMPMTSSAWNIDVRKPKRFAGWMPIVWIAAAVALLTCGWALLR